jgi:hypothetical protein
VVHRVSFQGMKSNRKKADDVISMALSGDILNWKPEPKDRFHDSRGRLTPYAFACGYIQEFSHNGVEVKLYKEGCWHVRAHDDDGNRIFWDSFQTLGEARRRFEGFRRELIRR